MHLAPAAPAEGCVLMALIVCSAAFVLVCAAVGLMLFYGVWRGKL